MFSASIMAQTDCTFFNAGGGKYLRYDESKNQKGNDSKVGDLSLHLPDPFSYLPDFDELQKRVNRPALLDRSKRKIADLDVITTIASVQIQTALSNVLRALDKVNLVDQRGYLRRSTHFFIRTKALQSHSYLLYPKGDAITPLNPRVFDDMGLKDGDILLSKDSNVGECAMVNGNSWGNHTLSGGIVRLRPSVNRFYLFAFLKHPLFITELRAKVPRGATIAHANELWLDCRIPFPAQENADAVVAYVAALAEAIFEKEKAIRARDIEIRQRIEAELSANQTGGPFRYEYPTSKELRATSRLDSSLYCLGFRTFQHRINHYRHGATSLSRLGVLSRRGPNLAVSVIGKSLYSDRPKPGWYELIRPVNISEYGTLSAREWLGSPRKLDQQVRFVKVLIIVLRTDAEHQFHCPHRLQLI